MLAFLSTPVKSRLVNWLHLTVCRMRLQVAVMAARTSCVRFSAVSLIPCQGAITGYDGADLSGSSERWNPNWELGDHEWRLKSD